MQISLPVDPNAFIIFTQPLYSGRIWHKVNLTGLNSEFSFS